MAQCVTPFTMKNPKSGTYMDVPCGKCLDCLNRRIAGWSFRLQQEERTATSAFFVTLTYDNFNVPITENLQLTLKKTDLQLFFKRLRKYELKQHQKNRTKSPPTVKYYAAGEYGTRTARPHYHIILFNATARGIEQSWGLNGRPLGDIHIDEVNPATIGYTLSYMCKDIGKQIPNPHNQYDDRNPIFSLASKGLGQNYLGTFKRSLKLDKDKNPILVQVKRVNRSTGEETTYNRKVYENILVKKSASHNYHRKSLNDRLFLPLPEGKKVAMPRYYKKKIYSDIERAVIGNKLAQQLQPIAEEHRAARVESNQIKMKNKRLNEKL
jgi:hypothetical protein